MNLSTYFNIRILWQVFSYVGFHTKNVSHIFFRIYYENYLTQTVNFMHKTSFILQLQQLLLLVMTIIIGLCHLIVHRAIKKTDGLSSRKVITSVRYPIQTRLQAWRRSLAIRTAPNDILRSADRCRFTCPSFQFFY